MTETTPGQTMQSAHINRRQSCHCVTFAKPSMYCLLYFLCHPILRIFNSENFYFLADNILTKFVTIWIPDKSCTVCFINGIVHLECN